MKTIKQLLRQKGKSVFGVILMTLAVAILCIWVGQSIAARTTILELEDAVKSLLGDCDGKTGPYLARIHCEKRRYYRDQLGVIRNLFDEWSPELIQKALAYCTEQELYSAGELSSAVAYISLLEEEKQNKAGGRAPRLPEKYRGGSPQIRDLSIYEEAMERRAANG